MTDKIDMSLDDIIKKDGIVGARRRGSSLQSRSRPQFRRSFGGRGRSSRGGGGSGRGGGYRNEPYFRNKIIQAQNAGRLLVSNLKYTVSDDDLNELFASFGPLRRSCIHHDPFGYSLGTAEVIFETKEDAMSALNKYNGVPLDGRDMRIQLVGGSAANAANGQKSVDGYGVERGRGRGARRGGRGSGVAYRNKNRLTAEDLDRDLDTYKMEVE